VLGLTILEELSVQLDVVFPFLWDFFVLENGFDGTLWFTGAARDALLWVDPKLDLVAIFRLEGVFAARFANLSDLFERGWTVYTIDGTNIDTSSVADTDAWFGDDIDHETAPC